MKSMHRLRFAVLPNGNEQIKIHRNESSRNSGKGKAQRKYLDWNEIISGYTRINIYC